MCIKLIDDMQMKCKFISAHVRPRNWHEFWESWNFHLLANVWFLAARVNYFFAGENVTLLIPSVYLKTWRVNENVKIVYCTCLTNIAITSGMGRAGTLVILCLARTLVVRWATGRLHLHVQQLHFANSLRHKAPNLRSGGQHGVLSAGATRALLLNSFISRRREHLGSYISCS